MRQTESWGEMATAPPGAGNRGQLALCSRRSHNLDLAHHLGFGIWERKLGKLAICLKDDSLDLETGIVGVQDEGREALAPGTLLRPRTLMKQIIAPGRLQPQVY